MEQRINELEIKVSYQDDTIERLHQALLEQQRRIDSLTEQVQGLHTLMAALSVSPVAPAEEETPPPHY